ncbi:hypothetical protein AOLI_G00026860 [Acnodon oligacanthus]
MCNVRPVRRPQVRDTVTAVTLGWRNAGLGLCGHMTLGVPPRHWLRTSGAQDGEPPGVAANVNGDVAGGKPSLFPSERPSYRIPITRWLIPRPRGFLDAAVAEREGDEGDECDPVENLT